MEKVHKKCMFLCFHVNIKHESTRTCMFPCNFPFSDYCHSIMVKAII